MYIVCFYVFLYKLLLVDSNTRSEYDPLYFMIVNSKPKSVNKNGELKKQHIYIPNYKIKASQKSGNFKFKLF